MSINVSVIGNTISVRRGQMFMTDLDQIKKNERDRLRRLRLEQVRQQSKEISNRLLERARNVAQKEWDRLDKDPRSELKRMHQQKIMEIQQKYQEDMEDIGMSHAAAYAQSQLEKRQTGLCEEQREIDRLNVLRRGEEAKKIIQQSSKKMDPEKNCINRIKRTRQVEDLRSYMVAKLPKKSPAKVIATKKNKTLPRKLVVVNKKKFHKKKSPKITYNVQKSVDSDDQTPRTSIPVAHTTSIDIDQSRFDIDTTLDCNSSSSSSTTSDDSSYFSDSNERQFNKTCKDQKVQMYDHSARHSSTYDTSHNIVEKLETQTKPNAIEAAEILKSKDNSTPELLKTSKLKAEKRGQDAMLREKVRRDYQTLLKNLEQLERKEHMLKVSQVDNDYAKGIHQKNLDEKHDEKLNRAFKTILNDTCMDCLTNKSPYLNKAPITLPPRGENSKTLSNQVRWEDAHCQSWTKLSRDEHILEMLKKVERQRRLLLQEFGANLPNNIYNTILNTYDDEPQVTVKPLSPEIKVIDMSNDEKKPSKNIETAVQTMEILPQDKSIQVELIKDDMQQHPIEPKVTITTHEPEHTSSSSLLTDIAIDKENKEIKVSPKKKRAMRGRKRISQKSSDTSTSFASLPLIKPMLSKATSYSTPILEMLDSSHESNIRQIRENISPVSTPETPSPRTMRLPSNVPHADKFIKILQQSKHCNCNNPNCRFLHKKCTGMVVDNSPQGLKKYQELQKVCAERIASLNDLIHQVRNEKKGIDIDWPTMMEQTVDETSLMGLPTPKPMKAELHSIRKIIESIEGIENQLSRTLEKSQRIIRLPDNNDNNSSNVVKPKIISDEKVNIKLNHFKIQQKENDIEKLSEEILEDSKIHHMIPEQEYPNERLKGDNSFVPMLAGIPKISRSTGKPPVSLHSTPYRTPQIETIGHELSTIMEFDTPDTSKLNQSPKKKKLWPGKEQELEETSDHNISLTSLEDLEKYKLVMAQSLHSLAVQSNKQLQSDANELLLKLKELQIELPDLMSNKDMTTSFSGLSGISEITTTTPSSSEIMKNHSSTEEEMETALKKLRLGWALTTLKKTREASALGSSSNSDGTPVNTARRLLSPNKKPSDTGLPDLSDLSSISMRETNKSTEQSLLITKGRTSTPNRRELTSISGSNPTTSNSSSISYQEMSNGSLIKLTSDSKSNRL